MQIQLYENFNKRINSTKIPSTTPITIDCTLKENTSIESPVFLLTRYDNKYNYVQWGNHYYFVNDIIYGINNYYEVHCVADILATYREQILNSVQFVKRSASNFDKYINDALLSQKQSIVNVDVTTTDITQFNSAGCYMVRVVGIESSSSGISTYVMNIEQLARLMTIAFDPNSFGGSLADETIKSIFNPMEYIVDIKWFPFDVDYIAPNINPTSIKLGWWSMNAVGRLLPDNVVGKGFGDDVYLGENQNYFGDFRDYNSNYTMVKMWIPSVGLVEISPQDIEHGLRYRYVIDFLTGHCDVFLSSGVRTFSQLQGIIGIPIQISQAITNVAGIISSTASAVTSAISGNTLAAATSGIDAIKNIFDKTISTIGNVGNITLFTAYKNIGIYYTRFACADYPTDVAGRPLMQNVLLSTLTGYTECGNASIDIAGLGQEKEEVNNMLNSGFYIE